MRKQVFILFFIVLGLKIALIYLNNHFLVTDEVAESAVHGDYTESHVQFWKDTNQIFTGFDLIKSSIGMISTVLISSVLMYLFVGLSNLKVSMSQVIFAVISGYACFLLPDLIRFFYFGVFKTDFVYFELAYFDNPFALSTLLDIGFRTDLWGTLSRELSLEYVFFILVMAASLYKVAEKSFIKIALFGLAPTLSIIALTVYIKLLF